MCKNAYKKESVLHYRSLLVIIENPQQNPFRFSKTLGYVSTDRLFITRVVLIVLNYASRQIFQKARDYASICNIFNFLTVTLSCHFILQKSL